MTHTTETYKGFSIQKRTDTKTHTCIIYKGETIVKCIAGNILQDGSNNAVQKAKNWIDNNIKL